MIAAFALLAAALAQAPVPSAEQQIRAQRRAFNDALARSDLVAIATFLAENAQIMTGRASSVFSGRAAQIGMWWEDLQELDRATYVRTPGPHRAVANRTNGDGVRPLARRES